MTEIKGKYKVKKFKHGGPRTAGKGKKLGKPAKIGKGGKAYLDYLDQETIATLKMISPNRSEAIRTMSKLYKEQISGTPAPDK